MLIINWLDFSLVQLFFNTNSTSSHELKLTYGTCNICDIVIRLKKKRIQSDAQSQCTIRKSVLNRPFKELNVTCCVSDNKEAYD